MSYILLNDFQGKLRTDMVQRLSDMAFISNDMSNRDWMEYQTWIKAGNQPNPPIPKDDSARKKNRDTSYKENLAMVALFNEAKKSNPTLDFSSYLDSVESTKDSIIAEVSNG